MSVESDKSLKITASDIMLLKYLQKNARATLKELAVYAGYQSPSGVLERLKRLEERNIILEYETKLNKNALGYKVSVLTHVKIKEHYEAVIHDFEDHVKNLEEVKWFFHVTGEYDYILMVVCQDIETYHSFVVKKLSKIPNIMTVHSSFVLKEVECNSLL
ncbi:AsnC family transcriptional regulator [Thermaurantimonas aggregans]|uniref:AsnC family transcriptional regulator n=1 Tax=Thermaurantimonas aggregans TaxID=2173829 RepID=A0A401XIE2_9FLAO|nr:Lrp/AsnC family transcriptional regulator [Thermaurantimonas aggregans]MCX8149094.1 Lrp/AsnC family transcriptional regulator [Thermaurantimonas aggregans]GCD76785.1 AsnC family transcriptional regulator [Thermaurantimonas aggregans]